MVGRRRLPFRGADASLETVDDVDDNVSGGDGSNNNDDGDEWPDGSEDDGAGDDDGSDDEGGGDEPPPRADCEEIEAAAIDVLAVNCAGCHDADSNTAGFGFVTDIERLIVSAKVVPGDAAGSPLFTRMSGGSMPPASAPIRPTDDEIALVGSWINECLDGVNTDCPDQPWISAATMVDRMLADIASVPPVDRRFTRYLTLTHLHNVGMCPDDLDDIRFGLNKAINSLSLDPTITNPVAIDQEETIYRIDLRDYDWESTQGVDKWELLVDNNPFAYRLVDDDAEVLQVFTGTAVPFMAADWLVHDASEPPLYYDMVEIPGTLGELEQILGINIEQNIATFEVARAGFLTSGVSQSNRVFERHQLPFAPNGALWLSYDFESNAGAQSIFANPLDFVESGGEGIYNLPNGLQAYFITNAAGVRLDEAPINIVTDPLQEDKVVRAGISCMSCHDSGLKLKADELRTFVTNSLDFDTTTKELVQELHPPATELTSLIQVGSNTFNDAVAQTGNSPGSIEPIIKTWATFEANVDLDRAAAELGVDPIALLSQLGELDPTYAPLATGVITRETFEAKFAESVCRLNLGVANDPSCQ